MFKDSQYAAQRLSHSNNASEVVVATLGKHEARGQNCSVFHVYDRIASGEAPL
jgi:hypothetical protein